MTEFCDAMPILDRFDNAVMTEDETVVTGKDRNTQKDFVEIAVT